MTAAATGSLVDRWRQRVVQAARRRGWEVRHLDPFLRIDDYLCRVLFPHLGVDCVLDVGAHTGEYASSLRAAGYEGDIVSFEPVAASFDRLASRARADPRWDVHRIALGAADEVRSMNVTTTTQFSSLRTPRHDRVVEFATLGNVVHDHEDVTVRRLDGAIAGAAYDVSARRVFLKLDTQGWDLEVLAGVGAVDASIVGVQSEMSILPIYDGMPDFRAAIEALAARGFEIAGMFPVSRDQHLRLVEFDCVTLRRPRDEPANA